MYAYFIYIFILNIKYELSISLKLYLIIKKKINWSSTHILAQYAKNVVSNVIWIEEIPSMGMIELVLAQDVLFLSSS